MRFLVVAIVMIGCHGGSGREELVDAGSGTDHLKAIFDEVDGARIARTLRELSGVVPVTVNGTSITLGERFDNAGRRRVHQGAVAERGVRPGRRGR